MKMSNEPLFLEPYFQEKIWGGDRLHTEYGYQIPSDHTGECWAISAHTHGPAIVENGPYKGLTLTEVWDKHREVFGNAKGDVFPLLTKILDAKADLSVQVHPDDAYAKEHEGELGKTECWYVLAADKGAQMYYGHHAKTREELAEMIENKQWDKLLRKISVKAGDFLYVPAGTIHAIGKGIMVLETQQSSDTTYRYIQTTVTGDKKITRFVDTDFFAVYKWEINGSSTFERQQAPYTLVSVLDGNGQLEVESRTYELKKGMHFILPYAVKSWTLAGKMMLIASEPGKKA